MMAEGYKNKLLVKLMEDDFGAMKVVVCPQELALEPGPVCWERDPDSPFRFTFKELDIAKPPFDIIERTDDRICVSSDAHISFYTYTIVVAYDGALYDTLQPSCEEQAQRVMFSIRGDRPVIRPK
jgi:hypothetical protein